MITLFICIIVLLLVVIERHRRKIKKLNAESNRYKNNGLILMKARRHGVSWIQQNLGPWPEMTPENFKREYECDWTKQGPGKITSEVPE